jgi:alkylhydroperoxidase/carboxymuconolactone decarboxylase family protein YurZ
VEIKEVLLQTAIYCGVPAANAAFALAQRVLGEAEGRHTTPAR